MKQISWCNAMLVAYSAIPQIVKTYDFGVKTRVESGFASKHLRIGISTEELFNEIIKLNDYKRKIINLKVIIDTCLSTMDEKDTKLIELRYFKKLTFQAICEKTNVCLRTVFRRHKRATQNFCSTLKNLGYGEEFLQNEYGEIEILNAIKKRMEETEYLTFENI